MSLFTNSIQKVFSVCAFSAQVSISSVCLVRIILQWYGFSSFSSSCKVSQMTDANAAVKKVENI